jgi:hypothetical protein
MKQLILMTVLFSIQFSGLYAQTNTESNLSAEDSSRIIKDLQSLLDSTDAPYSYTMVSVGISNRYFSQRNNSINSKQSTTTTLVFNPQAGYFHKSGFSLSAGLFLLDDKNKGFGINQYSVTPAFDLLNNKYIDAGVSYTRYFVSDKYSPYSSPIQNDLYGYISYKKTWLEPGFALGYSTGEYKQVRRVDTFLPGGIRRKLYDSATFKLNAFSMMLTASHQFGFEKIFGKNDQLLFQPTLMLNMGSSETKISHITNAPPGLLNFLYRRGKVPRLQTTKFQLESLGLNLDLSYTIGKFTLTPQVYLDYYLQNEDIDKFSYNFNFNIGFAF